METETPRQPTRLLENLDPRQKNAFTKIARLYRDEYEVPIRTRKDLIEFFGVDTIDQAIQEGSRFYNIEVDKKNILREKEARIQRENARKQRIEKQGLKRFESKIAIKDFDFSFRFNSVDQFIKFIEKIPADKSILMTMNGLIYALNPYTRERLMSIMLHEVEPTKSDEELISIFTGDTNIHFKELKERDGGYSLNEGGFFAFTHDTQIDLTDFQISTKIDVEMLEDNCFIYALKMSKIIPEKVSSICSEMIGRDIPQRKLKELAEKFNIYITVQKPQAGATIKTKIVEYGINTNPHLRLGLLEEHYFIIKGVPYTDYAIRNYELLKNKERWGEFYKQGAREKKRFINSYDLILLMKECGYFLPMEMTHELMKTVYHDKVAEIHTLVEVDDTNSKLNEYEPKKGNDFINVVFDFETLTQEPTHRAYMVHIFNDELDKTFDGLQCGRQMLMYLTKLGKNVRLIAHNAGYDLRFIFEHLCNFTMINRDKSLLRGYGTYYFGNASIKVEIQCSYAYIPKKLSEFHDMFKIDVKKEVMPYEIYTYKNILKRYLPKKCFNGIKDHDEFFDNCKEWNCIVDDKVDIIKYSQIYCRMDCIVLWKGYNLFKKWIQEVCGLNIDDYVSIASIANAYMLKEGVYDGCYMLSGVPREFIQRAMVGGRTMTCENKMIHVKEEVVPYDKNGLYVASMVRGGGYLKGRPKILTELNYEFLQKCDGYFVEIKILQVNKHYKFPLLSKKGDVREWTNDMKGEIIVVDKTSLEDLIQFQQIEFEIIKGYYYNEGRNNKIKEVMHYLFNTRKIHKKNKNPIQEVFKLLMNSAYGKTLLKPFDTESKYIKKLDDHVKKYYKHIKEIIPLHNGTYKVEQYKSICEHFNNCYAGVEVLSMSKRIMNEVMCLAEDNNVDMYYQDTDSIHLKKIHVPILEEAFKSKYGRELIGDELGTFHIDFKSDILKGDLVSKDSIYLGKKCYIETMSDGTGIDYHIRMKAVNTPSIYYYGMVNMLTPLEIYKNLYDYEAIPFDLTCGGKKCCFKYNNDMTITSLYKFERVIQFGDKKLDKKEELLKKMRW
jgi:hypothetical protein